ncbi:MAG: hypothetical protein HQK65_06300 [Desulfamplus sp.]|nr:hypothetical protein [Desulfamplus sp.]
MKNEIQGNLGKFGKDFRVGCLAITFILLLLFIGIPLAIFAFKISIAIAIPVITLVAVVIGVAFFGKIILFLKDRW